MSSRLHSESSFASVLTTTLWTSCLLVGAIGFVMPYAKATFAAPPPPPIQAEILKIELTADEPLAELPPPPNTLTPPPTLDTVASPPAAPALIPVAVPAPTIAFALPVAGPTRVVPVEKASYSAPVQTAMVAKETQPPVTPLVFGRGEGKQPRPDYPPRAEREGQEGTVRVQFTVGPDGRTIAAELASSSPWPLLNEEAIRTIRERWRFSPGPIRRYEVAIRFNL